MFQTSEPFDYSELSTTSETSMSGTRHEHSKTNFCILSGKAEGRRKNKIEGIPRNSYVPSMPFQNNVTRNN
eukprot:3456147-Rhodomonas_salina.1